MDPDHVYHKLRSHNIQSQAFNTEPPVMVECVPSFVCTRHTYCWGSKGCQYRDAAYLYKFKYSTTGTGRVARLLSTLLNM